MTPSETIQDNMDSKLLSDKKYEELLDSRNKPLTETQIHQLRQIDRAEAVLNIYQQESPEEVRDEAFTTMKRRQMEILTNEREKSWERFVDSLPEPLIDKLNIL